MEAYTLWWNGETLRKMLDYNTKYSPIMDNNTLLWQGGPNMEVQTQLVAFRQNHVKLAWALINILNAIHRFGILHNDLSKDNIMLHFSQYKLDVVYIGVCN
jgi:serine/threonine protein kinase